MTHLKSSPDDKPKYTGDFDDVYRAELDYVIKRREKINRYFGHSPWIAPTGTVVGAIPCGCPGCFY